MTPPPPVSGGRGVAGAFAERAAAAAQQACRAAGLDPSGATALRLGENALFRLRSAPVIVRVARGTDYLPAVRREVGVSRWLAAAGFPVVETVAALDQPVVASGLPVTFWQAIDVAARPATHTELGELLRRLHALAPPAELALPPFDPFTRSLARIEAAPAAAAADRVFLRELAAELQAAVADLRFESAPVPVHADGHLGNVVVDEHDRAVLLDLEYFCLDHPEWDLMTTAATHVSCTWTTEAEYQQFCAAYGRDLRDWSGFRVVRRLQEFLMTTWLMQNVLDDDAIAHEVSTRVADLRRPDDVPRHWRPF